MKFVHAADIHLDSPLQALALQDVAQIARMRRATARLDRMIEFCIEHQIRSLCLRVISMTTTAPICKSRCFSVIS